MKCLAFVTLSFIALVIRDSKAETASRDLRRGWEGGHHGGGHHGGGHHGGGHHGGKSNHTHGNMTEWLNQTCTSNNITCTEIDDDFLANCTYHKHHDHESSGDTGRELFVFLDETEEGTDNQDGDLQELYVMFEDGDWSEQDEEEDSHPTELRGIASQDERDLHKKRRHHGGGGGGPRPKSGKWGNLTDAEFDAMKLKRLTCKCCGNNTIN